MSSFTPLSKPALGAVQQWLRQQYDAVLALAFAPGGTQLAASTKLGRLLLWDVLQALESDPELGQSAVQAPAWATDLDGSPIHTLVTHNDALLAVTREKLYVFSWQRLLNNDPSHSCIRLDVRCSTALILDEHQIVLAGDEGSLAIASSWSTGRPLTVTRRLDGHPRTIHGLDLNINQGLLASCGAEGAVRLWDLRASTCSMKIVPSEAPLFSVAVDPEVRWLACGGSAPASLWSIKNSKEAVLQLSKKPDFQTQRLRFREDKVIVAGDESKVRFCSFTGHHREVGTHLSSVYAFAFNEDSAPGHAKVMAIAGLGQEVSLALAPSYAYAPLSLSLSGRNAIV